MRRLTKSRAKGPYEMCLGNGRDLREVEDVERLSVGAVDRVARPQHPAVELLHSPGHPTMLKELEGRTREPGEAGVAAGLCCFLLLS